MEWMEPGYADKIRAQMTALDPDKTGLGGSEAYKRISDSSGSTTMQGTPKGDDGTAEGESGEKRDSGLGWVQLSGNANSETHGGLPTAHTANSSAQNSTPASPTSPITPTDDQRWRVFRGPTEIQAGTERSEVPRSANTAGRLRDSVDTLGRKVPWWGRGLV